MFARCVVVAGLTVYSLQCFCTERLDNGAARYTLSCQHEFHFECLTKWLEEADFSICPVCRRAEEY